MKLTRRDFIKSGALLGAGLIIRTSKAQRNLRPNFIFILSDDHRWDYLSCAGHPYLKTASLDRLAKEGVRFTNAFVTTSLCSPSRASFLTGQYAHTHRITRNGSLVGKLPQTFLEILKKSYYGRLIREEALGEILPKLYQKATKMGRVKPISQADIEQMEYEEGKPLRFAASVEVEPEIEVKDYKGLEVVKQVRQITDEDIEARIQKLREESGVERVVERPAKEGDLVLVDLQKLDKSGVPVVGSKIENQLVKLTPESLPELFDATKGEERKVVLTYPEDHPDANLAGTQERYLAKVKEVRERELPALDDEFAKDCLLYTSPSPRDLSTSRMPSSA